MAEASKLQKGKLPISQIFGFFSKILAPERGFFVLVIIYGIGISLLSLATPISVQMLINTVANTGLITPLVVLSASLFGLLLISGLLNALRIHLMEIFARRFYARMVAEISLRAVYAQNPFFDDVSRSALFNRYFDIIGVQKAIPVLFIGGFTVILQAGVGFVLVSLYHPLFLVFNLILIGLIWLIWVVLGASAMRSSIDLSHAKHNAAAWLEDIAASNGFFKSEKRVAYALDKTDEHTRAYVDQHRKHFRRHYAQTLSFLFLYAAASAMLLGLGGWLVIQAQLTLGQLVAAELVLSAAFFGVSQLGIYLNYFYDLCAAVEELSLFYDVEQEEPVGDDILAGLDHALVFNNLRGEARGRPAHLHLEIPSSAIVMAAASNYGVQRLFTSILKRHVLADSGFVTIGGVDIMGLDTHNLRKGVYVVDRPNFVGLTIRDYLSLSAQEDGEQSIPEVLEIVGLSAAVASLDAGLDTKLARTGWPLSIIEVMQLKLANCLIARPKILILNQLYDLLEEEHLVRVMTELRNSSSTTVIYFSNRHVNLGFDTFVYFDNDEQTFYETFEDFCDAAHGGKPKRPASPRRITSEKPNLIEES